MLWKKSWGGIRVIGCQLLLTAAMVFGVVFSTLYWNQAVAVSEVISGPQFDEDGRFTMKVEKFRGFRREDRHWLTLNPDGNWQELKRLRTVEGTAPYQFWSEAVGTQCQRGVTGPETDIVFESGAYGLQPPELDGIVYKKEGRTWVWRRGSNEHTFPEEYHFVWFVQGHFFFTHKDTKGLLAISAETFEEYRIFEGERDFRVTKNGVFYKNAKETVYYSLLTKTPRRLEQIEPSWDLGLARYSPSRDKLLFELNGNFAVVFDTETFATEEVSFPGEEWDLVWLNDEIIGGTRGFYSIETGRWTQLEKSNSSPLTLDPTEQYLYSKEGRSTIWVHDLNGRLLKTIEVD